MDDTTARTARQFTAGCDPHTLMKVVVSTTVGPTVARRALAHTIRCRI